MSQAGRKAKNPMLKVMAFLTGISFILSPVNVFAQQQEKALLTEQGYVPTVAATGSVESTTPEPGLPNPNYPVSSPLSQSDVSAKTIKSNESLTVYVMPAPDVLFLQNLTQVKIDAKDSGQSAAILAELGGGDLSNLMHAKSDEWDVWRLDVYGDGSVIRNKATAFKDGVATGKVTYSTETKAIAADEGLLAELGGSQLGNLTHVTTYSGAFNADQVLKSDCWQLDLSGDGSLTRSRSSSVKSGVIDPTNITWSQQVKATSADAAILAELGSGLIDNLTHVETYAGAFNAMQALKSDAWQLDVYGDGSVIRSKIRFTREVGLPPADGKQWETSIDYVWREQIKATSADLGVFNELSGGLEGISLSNLTQVNTYAGAFNTVQVLQSDAWQLDVSGDGSLTRSKSFSVKNGVMDPKSITYSEQRKMTAEEVGNIINNSAIDLSHVVTVTYGDNGKATAAVAGDLTKLTDVEILSKLKESLIKNLPLGNLTRVRTYGSAFNTVQTLTGEYLRWNERKGGTTVLAPSSRGDISNLVGEKPDTKDSLRPEDQSFSFNKDVVNPENANWGERIKIATADSAQGNGKEEYKALGKVLLEDETAMNIFLKSPNDRDPLLLWHLFQKHMSKEDPERYEKVRRRILDIYLQAKAGEGLKVAADPARPLTSQEFIQIQSTDLYLSGIMTYEQTEAARQILLKALGSKTLSINLTSKGTPASTDLSKDDRSDRANFIRAFVDYINALAQPEQGVANASEQKSGSSASTEIMGGRLLPALQKLMAQPGLTTVTTSPSNLANLLGGMAVTALRDLGDKTEENFKGQDLERALAVKEDLRSGQAPAGLSPENGRDSRKILNSVSIDNELAAMDALMNPSKSLHPFLRWYLYKKYVSEERLERYEKARQKILDIYLQAKAGKGLIRYKERTGSAYLPFLDERGGSYELVTIR